MARTAVTIHRLPIGLPCPVPVLPSSPDTANVNGEPLPMEQRTERCHVNAWWMIGKQITCDVHLRIACEHAGIDFDGVVEEGGGLHREERLPWLERYRYPQEPV